MYHILYSNSYGTNMLMDLDEKQLKKVVDAYKIGKPKIYIRGEIQSFGGLRSMKIYKATKLWKEKTVSAQVLADKGFIEPNFYGRRASLNLKGMALFGEDITEKILTMDFGEFKEENEAKAETNKSDLAQQRDRFDYAIITALYKDELKYVEPYINYEGEIAEDDKKLIRFGTLKTNREIKIVYASLLNTGMVDAAIVATDIITQFNPRILIMPGVCGGKDVEHLDLEDIIVATKVYTFQKGKLQDDKFLGEWEGVELNDKLIQKIQAEEENIIGELHFKGKIHYEPMACSTAVIDKIGVLEDIAQMKDRKTLGLEMEGYGIARACQIANNGNTKTLIVKSVMDKTSDKNDAVKKEAAQHSANFVMKMIELGVV